MLLHSAGVCVSSSRAIPRRFATQSGRASVCSTHTRVRGRGGSRGVCAEACVRSGVQDAEARARVLLVLATLRDAEAGLSVGREGGGGVPRRALRPPGAGERLAAARRAAAAAEDAAREEAAGRSA
eukprot:Rhum_TRINITY_DN15444_c1_g5::Rhum_TRINITY_DN15444_c1_g5_i1::g.157242::m.157242